MLDRSLDCLVIGAGPAGLQLGARLRAAGRDYLILEAGEAAGAFFTVFPRHRTLISINKPHTGTEDPELNLRMDWNSLLSDDPALLFKNYSARYFPAADDFVRYLRDFAERLELRVQYGTRVERITRDGADGDFIATDAQGREYRAKRLVMATGVSLPYIPPIPGVELAEPYTEVSVDPAQFTDQRVLILGKGNSAFETADRLMETAAVIHVAGPHSLRLAWQTHYVGHLRAVNNNFLDSYQLKSQNALLDGRVLSIEREPATDDAKPGLLVRFSFVRANETVKELRYDRVIVATGFRFDASPFDPRIRPRLVINDRFPEQTHAFESVNVPGLYFAGTVMQQRDFKHGTSGFIHGFRYSVRALSRILEQRHHDAPWPHTSCTATPEAIADAMIARVNRSSGLWQQFAVLADLVVVPPGGVEAHYHEELPVDFLLQEGVPGGEPGADADLFAVTLEYGPDHDKFDPFDVTVRRTAQDAADSAFDTSYLHPVVRHYRAGALLGTHHLAENLENEWDKPQVHRAPLVAFLASALSHAAARS